MNEKQMAEPMRHAGGARLPGALRRFDIALDFDLSHSKLKFNIIKFWNDFNIELSKRPNSIFVAVFIWSVNPGVTAGWHTRRSSSMPERTPARELVL